MSQPAPFAAPLLKLLDVLEEENAVLKENRVVSHASFTDRKNQALRELMAAQRAGISHEGGADHTALLQRLTASLQTNARLLKLQISAVGEISDIIIAGLRESESDGTYSRNRAQRG